ncbi:MAG: L,D-transpeptidase [Chloroflexota bacterium]
MRRFVLVLFFFLFLAGGGIRLVAAEGDGPAVEAPQAGAVLCPSGMALAGLPDCLRLGAAGYAEQMSEKGLTFPLRPLPAVKPDASLAAVDFYYARLKDDVDTPVFSTLDDAMLGKNPTYYIAHGPLRFISYINTHNADGGDKPHYFQLRDGNWVTADSVASRVGAVPRFQGMIFSRTPANAFGWIIPLNPTAETKRTPGFAQNDLTGQVYSEYDLVQVYDVQTVDGAEWVMLGPDEWLEARLVGTVTPRTAPPEGVSGLRWIEVNLDEQTLAVYDGGQMAYATMIATGLEPFWTRPGTFQIREKLEQTMMRGTFEADQSDFYYLEDVPWTMYFDGARALHAAYWRARFGFAQSHGCVNLAPGDAHWLFDWAQVGDPVYVWDPSGKTPTDPSLYSSGAP